MALLGLYFVYNLNLTNIYRYSSYLTKNIVVGKDGVPKNYKKILEFIDKSEDMVEIIVLDDFDVFITVHQLIHEGESIHYTTYNKRFFSPFLWYNSDKSEMSCSRVIAKDEANRRAYYLTGCPTEDKFLFGISSSH